MGNRGVKISCDISEDAKSLLDSLCFNHERPQGWLIDRMIKKYGADEKPVKKESTEVAVAKFNFKAELLALDVDKNVLDDWMAVRKKLKATNTETAFKRLMTEIQKSGLSVAAAVEFAAGKEWKGFQADWYKKEQGKSTGNHRANIDLDDTSWADDLNLEE